MKYLLLSQKKWHDALFDRLKSRKEENWVRISDKSDFNLEKLNSIKPDRIFIPHWSHIIDETIWRNFECIVFHMTDLPFGRGGSPLQNLIVRGYSETKISAIKVSKGIDTGEVFLKSELNLNGTAQEIFLRSSLIIEQMIDEIISSSLKPVAQQGKPVTFKRRKPEEGNLSKLNELNQAFDYIRMLDCEGYPKAFIETEHFKFEFTRASLKADNSILADVRILKK